MAGYTNNNQMESFNGNTVRHREKVVRGLKTDDSAILSGLRLDRMRNPPLTAINLDQARSRATSNA